MDQVRKLAEFPAYVLVILHAVNETQYSETCQQPEDHGKDQQEEQSGAYGQVSEIHFLK